MVQVCVCVCVCVCEVALVVSNSATQWTETHQAPLSTEFTRQEYWGGLPCPPPGIFPTQESSLMSPALAGEVLYHWYHLGGLNLAKKP